VFLIILNGGHFLTKMKSLTLSYNALFMSWYSSSHQILGKLIYHIGFLQLAWTELAYNWHFFNSKFYIYEKHCVHSHNMLDCFTSIMIKKWRIRTHKKIIPFLGKLCLGSASVVLQDNLIGCFKVFVYELLRWDEPYWFFLSIDNYKLDLI
jgi:hypothetical protein